MQSLYEANIRKSGTKVKRKTCLYICEGVNLRTCWHMCVHRLFINMCTYKYTCVHTCVYVRIQTQRHSYTDVNSDTRTLAQVHVHMRKYTYTCVHSCTYVPKQHTKTKAPSRERRAAFGLPTLLPTVPLIWSGSAVAI